MRKWEYCIADSQDTPREEAYKDLKREGAESS